MKYPVGFRHVPDKIALIIGIFCMENFPYNGLKMIVEEHCGVKMEDVVKMDIGKGKFWVYTRWGDVKAIKLKETHPYEQIACHVCTDYTAELADISTGSVGSPDGWSTVFIRTAKGEEIFNKGKLNFHGVVRITVFPEGYLLPYLLHQLQVRFQDAQGSLVPLLQGGQDTVAGPQVPPHHHYGVEVPVQAGKNLQGDLSGKLPAGVGGNPG
jgi:hypothetical protein